MPPRARALNRVHPGGPIVSLTYGKGRTLTVTVLEKTPEYIHLAVTVSDGGVSAFVPVM